MFTKNKRNDEASKEKASSLVIDTSINVENQDKVAAPVTPTRFPRRWFNPSRSEPTNSIASSAKTTRKLSG